MGGVGTVRVGGRGDYTHLSFLSDFGASPKFDPASRNQGVSIVHGKQYMVVMRPPCSGMEKRWTGGHFCLTCTVEGEPLEGQIRSTSTGGPRSSDAPCSQCGRHCIPEPFSFIIQALPSGQTTCRY